MLVRKGNGKYAMNLQYKPDWEETKARYRAWWNHAYFGRCALAVYAPHEPRPDLPEPAGPKTLEERWFDLEAINRRAQHAMASTFYGGEAIPIWSGGYPGHTCLPVFMGATCTLDMHTGWIEPVIHQEDEPDIRRLKIDTEHPNYRLAVESVVRGSAWMRGKGLMTIGAFGGCGDTLAALRTTDRLLYDCVDRPDWVRDAECHLMDLWCDHYGMLYRNICEADEGSTCWFPLWAPGKFYAAQNDFAYMIGPGMFQDLFLPAIRRQLDYLDYAVYHVDGIGNFAHVDTLCGLERLQAIQILPGAGKPSPLHFIDVLRKVQRAGKNLHISLPADEVRSALDQLSARGLYIQTWCRSEPEARGLLEQAERWSVDRG
ncbi:MAG: hypothetical protein A2498_05490 [Lentisphaerae bacterium RIFOXYC12_FULL_60_16]|nr:MAG: hypothetical protein A2498_05490 [Lentisphaerae bacterium RIFOXYC12_FULL_60_16]OGV75509.1 MAG: hypothetical protein A2340_02325 [Lentisphaerae bacterium RIFOXYB12_FULL_60_10]